VPAYAFRQIFGADAYLLALLLQLRAVFVPVQWFAGSGLPAGCVESATDSPEEVEQVRKEAVEEEEANKVDHFDGSFQTSQPSLQQASVDNSSSPMPQPQELGVCLPDQRNAPGFTFGNLALMSNWRWVPGEEQTQEYPKMLYRRDPGGDDEQTKI